VDETVKVYCSVDRDVETSSFSFRDETEILNGNGESERFSGQDLADRSTFDSVGHNLLTRSQAIAKI